MPRPVRRVSSACRARIVVLGEGGGDASLRVEAVGGRELAAAEDEHVRVVGCCQRGVQPCDSCADDDHSDRDTGFYPLSR